MKNPKAVILIVEDDPAILNGLSDVLVFNGYHPIGCTDGREGCKKAIDERFDLILLDVMLPTMDGYSICREIRKKKPDQPIIMLTAKGAETDIVTGLKSGADDYISKPFSLRELMARIEALMRRFGKNLGDERLTINGIYFDGANLKATCDGRAIDLTRREMDIIVYLHHNQSRIVSKKELLLNVWQYSDAEIETRTVDIHIQKLRKKISTLIGESSFLLTIRGEGYRLDTGGVSCETN